jgi:hypothetical protein
MSAVKPESRQLRHFGLLLGTLSVVFFAGIPLVRHHRAPLWPWTVAITLWLAALLAPRTLSYIHAGWTRLGQVLGWINTRVILSLMYVLAIIPIGLIMKFARHDPMRREFDPALESYRIRSEQRSADHLERPY